MNKLLVIGIDALDAVQVERYIDYLPNIARLKREGFYRQIESVWPPDSETAWATIYTGWNPAQHGIFQFVDPLEKTSKYISRERDNSILRGHTFWDAASREGQKVIVLFPHIGFPSWEVNGIMVTKASLNREISVFPEHIKKKYAFEGLNEVKGLAGRDPQAYLDAVREQVYRQLELNLQMLQGEEWNLFFTYWSALDLIQHQFWAYCDPRDPTHPGDTPYKNVIRDFYVLHDEVLGKLIASAGDDVDIIVLSDHGQGMRPVKIFNINRVLRENGLLFLKEKSGSKKVKAFRGIKNLAVQGISRLRLGNLASKTLRKLPFLKKVFVSSVNLDLERTIAYITDMSGIKAYSYGGIQIRKENLNGKSYEAVRNQVISLLEAATDPSMGNARLVKWIKPREALYQGKYLNEYPDLVFELNPEYGAGWDADGPLFDVSHSHNLYPGSHLGSNAVVMLSGPSFGGTASCPRSLMEITSLVAEIFRF